MSFRIVSLTMLPVAVAWALFVPLGCFVSTAQAGTILDANFQAEAAHTEKISAPHADNAAKIAGTTLSETVVSESDATEPETNRNAPVPEPNATILLTAGALALLACLRRGARPRAS